MKISHWIADLITGGALSRARATAIDAHALWIAEVDRLADVHISNGRSLQRIARQNIALRAIAAMPTSKANATVRRMARVAEDALK